MVYYSYRYHFFAQPHQFNQQRKTYTFLLLVLQSGISNDFAMDKYRSLSSSLRHKFQTQ